MGIRRKFLMIQYSNTQFKNKFYFADLIQHENKLAFELEEVEWNEETQENDTIEKVIYSLGDFATADRLLTDAGWKFEYNKYL